MCRTIADEDGVGTDEGVNEVLQEPQDAEDLPEQAPPLGDDSGVEDEESRRQVDDVHVRNDSTEVQFDRNQASNNNQQGTTVTTDTRFAIMYTEHVVIFP